MSDIRISYEDMNTIINYLTSIKDIFEKYTNNISDGSYSEITGMRSSIENEFEKTSVFEDKDTKKVFYKTVKKILLKTPEKSGTITYGIYQIGYKKIDCSNVFEIYDVNSNEIIGEYLRDKNILRLYHINNKNNP